MENSMVVAFLDVFRCFPFRIGKHGKQGKQGKHGSEGRFLDSRSVEALPKPTE